LDQGLLLLDTILKNSKGKVVDGAKAFELYDTYGFPYDLTALIASERGFTVDETGFSSSMEEQKSRSRAAASSKAGDWIVLLENEKEEFVGYDDLDTQVKITRYRKMTTAKDGDFYQLVFSRTPFYPEGGGQVGDKGYLEASNGSVHYILNTKKENNLIIHYTKTLPVKLDEEFQAVVDAKQRQRTSCNHTATHLLHQALREVLGDHVEQKGSMVHSGMFRFDFSHFAKMTEEELKAVEQFVNARIQEQLPLQENRTAVLADAMAEGAMALFGEKYGDKVRTIRFGKSIELCGGTHTKNTAEIWHFKITSEGAVASGIRRIEAITGDAVKVHFEEQASLLEQVQAALNQPQDTIKAIESMQTEVASLKKEIQGLAKLQLQVIKEQLAEELETLNGIQFLATEVDLDAGLMKDLAFDLGQNKDALFLVLASSKGGKPLLSCYISKELVATKDLNAGTIVRELGKYIQGGGGGQAFFATAGGKNTDGIAAALKAAREMI
jgi:alanyl-tRNA synthetase